jgi:hypothetical integral membrane protein (TIGR02206 family)
MPAFTPYGPSHWVVLGVTMLGIAAWIRYGRRAGAGRGGRALGVAIVALNVGIEAVRLARAADPTQALPLQLSDLAPYAAGYALCSERAWAYALTYYWGLTLSTQALVTPVLSGPDFPSAEFLAFFTIHVLVVWAAVYLTWGRSIRPGWRDYRNTVAVTALWAGAMLAVNRSLGTNYGFVSAKPGTPSILDVLGPWPWYLVPEAGLILAAWALLTVLARVGRTTPAAG